MPNISMEYRDFEAYPTTRAETYVRDDDAGIARHFDLKATAAASEDSLEPVPITTRLLDLVADAAVGHPSMLDLGCGTGVDAIRLIEGGAKFVTGIDLSPASIDVARRLALESDFGPERARFVVGDVASVSLEPHDWVILDRVICCYGDANRLLSNALTAASRALAFSVPESRGWRGLLNMIGWNAESLWKAIFTRDSCRGYVHDVKKIERHLKAAGFTKTDSGRSGPWYAAVFERLGDPADQQLSTGLGRA